MQPTQQNRPSSHGRVWTVANVISLIRLLGVPLFLYLFLVADAPGYAVAVLTIGSMTDWVDGYVARRFGQVSRLGELLDPLVDRLYIVVTLIGLTVGGVIPLAFTAAMVLRDAMMGV